MAHSPTTSHRPVWRRVANLVDLLVGSAGERPGDAAIHAWSGAYALDALNSAERRRFEAHVWGCEACQIEVREFQVVASLLGEGSGATPPPQLRERVLAATGPAASARRKRA